MRHITPDVFGLRALDKERAAAEKRLDACNSILDDATVKQGKAHTALEKALLEVAEYSQKFEEAKARYAYSPSDPGAKAVSKAREAHELAELRANKPRAAAIEADRAVESASAPVAEVETELGAIKQRIVIAKMRECASLEHLYAEITPLWRTVTDAIGTARAAMQQIQTEWESSRLATNALREQGISCSESEELHFAHRYGPLLLRSIATDPLRSGGAISAIEDCNFGNPLINIGFEVVCPMADMVERYLVTRQPDASGESDVRALLRTRAPKYQGLQLAARTKEAVA